MIAKNVFAHCLEQNLLEHWSGRIAGGEAASQAIAKTVATLNYSGVTVIDIMMTMKNIVKKSGEAKSEASDSSDRNKVSPEKLKRRYKETS